MTTSLIFCGRNLVMICTYKSCIGSLLKCCANFAFHFSSLYPLCTKRGYIKLAGLCSKRNWIIKLNNITIFSADILRSEQLFKEEKTEVNYQTGR